VSKRLKLLISLTLGLLAAYCLMWILMASVTLAHGCEFIVEDPARELIIEAVISAGGIALATVTALQIRKEYFYGRPDDVSQAQEKDKGEDGVLRGLGLASRVLPSTTEAKDSQKAKEVSVDRAEPMCEY